MKVRYYFLGALFVFVLSACGESSFISSDGSAGNSASTGIGGSMSRFAIVDDMLYAISGDQLQLVNIEEADNPVLWSRVSMDFGIETLFAYKSYLFVGSQTGVFIYDNSIPQFPQYVSEFVHVRSCDPVVVQGNYAYVTLRGNNRCWGGANQLDILNISDIFNPVLEKSYPMQGPFGLGISGQKLFVCDGRAGLKVFDVTDNSMISSIETLAEINCYDVIPNNNILLVSSEAGLTQYQYDDQYLVKLSEIESLAQ